MWMNTTQVNYVIDVIIKHITCMEKKPRKFKKEYMNYQIIRFIVYYIVEAMDVNNIQ